MTRKLPRAAPGWAKAEVYTLGHSTRPLRELIAMLRAAEVRTLADVRTIPRSRTNPQFNAPRLKSALPKRGIAYVNLFELGGRRAPKKGGTKNGAWRNSAFRGYADHMQSEEFAAGLEKLRKLARKGPVAAMCAEGNPWRCHRNLLADALWARGVEARELTASGRWKAHRPIPFARFRGRTVTYPLGRG